MSVAVFFQAAGDEVFLNAGHGNGYGAGGEIRQGLGELRLLGGGSAEGFEIAGHAVSGKGDAAEDQLIAGEGLDRPGAPGRKVLDESSPGLESPAGIHLQQLRGVGMGDQDHFGAGDVAHEVLQVAGSQDGMAFLQLAGAGVQEGLAAGSQQEAFGVMQLEAGLGGEGLEGGIGLLPLGGDEGNQGTAVVQGDGHPVTAEGVQVADEGGIAGGQEALEETGGIGQQSGGLGGAVEYHDGGGIRGDGAEDMPGGIQLLLIGAGARRLVKPDHGQRNTGQK